MDKLGNSSYFHPSSFSYKDLYIIMNNQKPFSESCVQNQQPILEVLLPLLKDKERLLEIGSGTGQHAAFFAKNMPHLIWQTSDQSIYHDGIKLWLDEAGLDNTQPPLSLNVSMDQWPEKTFDTIFSANAVHIMSWENVVDYFKHACPLLEPQGYFILYGPFNYNGEYTSESNARFDQWLKNNDPKSCIKDFEKLNGLAEDGDMKFIDDIAMPANNRILIWQKNGQMTQ